MRRVAVLITALLSIGGSANAQTASGRAFGTTLDLLNSNLVDQSDVSRSAPSASNGSDPNKYDGTAAGSTFNLNPIAHIISGPSRVRGCSSSSGCPGLSVPPGLGPHFAYSEGGNATAGVLLNLATGGANLLDAVSNGSTAAVSCNGTGADTFAATSEIDALVIAGRKITIPGTVNPNTTIVVPELPLLVLNEQACPDVTAPAGTTRCSVNSLHAQLISPIITGVLDLKLSGATATISNSLCSSGGGGGCNPILTNSIKTSQILQSNRVTPKTPQVPAIGDPILFTIAATNSTAPNQTCPAGAQTGHNLRVIDRIPKGVTIDTATITIQTDNGTPVPTTGTIAACPASLQFSGCSGEPASDPSRQCLTVADGDLAPQQTKRISFIATVNSSAIGGTQPGCDSDGSGLGICNTALIQIDEIQNPSGTPRTSAIQCPKPGGDVIRTTGSGGCSLGLDSRGRSEAIPMLLVGAWLLIRRGRRHGARA